MTDGGDGQPAVLAERRGNAMVITINRPEARNAVNGAVSIGVGDALEEAQRDPDVRAVVITGAGDKSFCAGADLKAISRRENLYHPDHAEWGFAGYVHHFIDKPTIAAVNGTALGGGTELALASDLVVAATHSPQGVTTGTTMRYRRIVLLAKKLELMSPPPRPVPHHVAVVGESRAAAMSIPCQWGTVVARASSQWKTHRSRQRSAVTTEHSCRNHSEQGCSGM